MNASEEAGKNSDAWPIKCHWKEKSFSKIYTTMLLSIKSSSKLFEKYSSKSPFFFSAAIAEIWKNKQLSELIRRPWFLLSVTG